MLKEAILLRFPDLLRTDRDIVLVPDIAGFKRVRNKRKRHRPFARIDPNPMHHLSIGRARPVYRKGLTPGRAPPHMTGHALHHAESHIGRITILAILNAMPWRIKA